MKLNWRLGHLIVCSLEVIWLSKLVGFQDRDMDLDWNVYVVAMLMFWELFFFFIILEINRELH